MKTIIFTTAAARDFDALPVDVQQQVMAGLSRFAITGEGDVTKLKDRPGFRLRIGRYRVIYNEDRTSILAIYIGARQTNTY